jgi:hypothetical protein
MVYLAEFSSDLRHTPVTVFPPVPILPATTKVSVASQPYPICSTHTTEPAPVPHDSTVTFAAGPHVDLSAKAGAQRSCLDIATMQASPSISVIYRMVGDMGLLGDI